MLLLTKILKLSNTVLKTSDSFNKNSKTNNKTKKLAHNCCERFYSLVQNTFASCFNRQTNTNERQNFANNIVENNSSKTCTLIKEYQHKTDVEATHDQAFSKYLSPSYDSLNQTTLNDCNYTGIIENKNTIVAKKTERLKKESVPVLSRRDTPAGGLFENVNNSINKNLYQLQNQDLDVIGLV